MEVSGSKVKAIRKFRGISQYRLSQLTKISRHRISLFECGYVDLTPFEIESVIVALQMRWLQLPELST
jgi:transcriptional regulator with XRE-family HTH domain